MPALLRQAIDEVIDSRRTNRYTLNQLEKTEKTYLGTKIEILLRNALQFEHGKVLDLSIDGIEVDVKNTVGTQWTIPLEAVEHPCILIRADEANALCWFGLLVIREEHLNPGKNRDQKRSISAAARKRIHWLLEKTKYPENFWASLGTAAAEITGLSGGTERIAALFRYVQGRRISRNAVEALARQKDYMKRIRRNGGARDLLSPEGIAILWGKKDQALIEALGLPQCTRDEFISFKPVTEADLTLLRAAGHID